MSQGRHRVRGRNSGAQAQRTRRAEEGEPFARRVGRAVLAALLALVPLVFTTRTLEIFEFPKVLLLTSTAVVLATGAAALAFEWALLAGPRSVARTTGEALRREPLAWGVLACLLSAAVSTVTSLSPRTSWRGAHESFAGLVTIAAYATVFCAVWALCRTTAHALALLGAAGVGTSCAALYALAQLAGIDPVAWTRTHEFLGVTRVFGSMGNPNFLGALMAMSVPLAAALALRARRLGRNGSALLHAAAGALTIGALGASLSRGAWLAALAGVAVLAAGVVRLTEQRETRRRLVFAAAAALLAGALGVATVPRARTLATAMIGRVTLSLHQEARERPAGGLALSQDPRLALWSAAWGMFKEHPLVGVGLDAFQLAYQHRRDQVIWAVEGHRTPGKAHNEVLHTLATQGAVGGLALVLLGVGTVVTWRRALSAQAAERELVVGAGAALVAFSVQNLFSFTVAACGTLAAALLGLLAALRTAAPPSPPPRPPRPSLSGATALALGLLQTAVTALGATAFWLLVLRPLWADTAAQRGVVAQQAGPGRGLAGFAEAVHVDPGRDLYWTQLGVEHYTLAQSLSAPPARLGQLEAARTAFSNALALVPVNSYTQAGLARTLVELSKLQPPAVPLEAAYAAYERAMALDPRNPYWPAEAGRVALEAGDLERALTWGRRALEINPDYGPAAWVLASVDLQRVLPLLRSGDTQEVAAAFAPVGEALREAATGRRWFGDDALRAVCGSQAAAALVAAGRLEDARAVAELATQVDPNYADGRFNLGKVHERLGDRARAEHEYRQALRIQPDHPQARRALSALSQP